MPNLYGVCSPWAKEKGSESNEKPSYRENQEGGQGVIQKLLRQESKGGKVKCDLQKTKKETFPETGQR